VTNPFRLDNQIALITGGGTGIGLGIARCLAAAGAKVVLVGRREPELANAALSIGQAASFVVQDVTKFSEAPALVARVGRIDILVNNAGNDEGACRLPRRGVPSRGTVVRR